MGLGKGLAGHPGSFAFEWCKEDGGVETTDAIFASSRRHDGNPGLEQILGRYCKPW